MIFVLLTLAVISVLTEACERPMCTVQSANKVHCLVEKKDNQMVQPFNYTGKFSVKFYNSTESPQISKRGDIQIKIGKGTKKNPRFINIEVNKHNLPWIYIVRIRKNEVRKKDLLVLLSCLNMSTSESKINISVVLEIGPAARQKRRQKNNTNRNIRDIRATSSQQPITKTIGNEPIENKMQRSSQGVVRNCIVDFPSKTITFSWHNKEGSRVLECGLMRSTGEFIKGNNNETDKIVRCIAQFNNTDHYYSRIFFYETGRKFESPCDVFVNVTTLESYKPREVDTILAKDIDTTFVALLVILFTGMGILIVFIVCLYWSRKKLQHTINVSSDPKAMIVSVNEFENGVPILVGLLEGAMINVVTVASNVKENMWSRHDWLEKTVGECDHFIFIVTKEMGEILKRMISGHPKQRENVKSTDSQTDSEGETCAYTIALIRNKFIKSLKYDGYCVNSCHMVSFEENECDSILRSNQGRDLFPCIKTHYYNLYLKGRFQFSHACRIMNNIKMSENSKARKVTCSKPRKHPKESMDIEKAFVSLIPSTKCNFVPVSRTDSNENDSDIDIDVTIDVTSDLLGYEMSH